VECCPSRIAGRFGRVRAIGTDFARRRCCDADMDDNGTSALVAKVICRKIIANIMALKTEMSLIHECGFALIIILYLE
jgi:hypothetical protein